MRMSSNTWKSFVDGSPFGPRSTRSWRSRSSKNLGVARTTRRVGLTSAWEPTRSRRCVARADGAPVRGTRQERRPDRRQHSRRRALAARPDSSSRVRWQSQRSRTHTHPICAARLGRSTTRSSSQNARPAEEFKAFPIACWRHRWASPSWHATSGGGSPSETPRGDQIGKRVNVAHRLG